MKSGDLVWLVREVGGGKTMTPARLHTVGEKHIKIRIDNFGISSRIFVRNKPDAFPIYERTQRDNKAEYRLDIRA